MPKATSKRSKTKQEISSPELSEDEPEVAPARTETLSHRTTNKRNYNMVDKSGGGDCVPFAGATNNIDCGNDFRKMMDTINVDFNKIYQTKKKRFEQYTLGAMKINETKMKEMMQNQEEARRQLHEEFNRNFISAMDQWDVDLSRSKEQQQMRMVQQNQNAQTQRLAAIRRMHNTFHKSNTTQVELRKELEELQKRLMLEAQKEEMAHMQKYFQSMLFM
ncbi:Synaptonemal complex protein 3 [Blattella germanica]|nr:Synaptonemal complex protein 3 [Blattella germanica]